MATSTTNKVKFGLNKLYYAIITGYDENGKPTYATPVRFPGAVSLTLSANGSNDPFYADNIVYYMCASNSGYSGTLEIAMMTKEFMIDVLGFEEDDNGVLVEKNDTEAVEFALLFECEGDKHKIRHCFYRCTATRADVEGDTIEDTKEPKTDSVEITAMALENGVVKSRADGDANDSTFTNWYSDVYMDGMSFTD